MLMNTFEELTQAMDGCVQRVKEGRTPDVGRTTYNMRTLLATLLSGSA